MGKIALAFILVVSVSTTAKGASFPLKLSIKNSHRQSPAAIRQLKTDVLQACENIQRAKFLINNHWTSIFEYFGLKGANFSVLHRNRSFYTKKISNRYHVCRQGRLKYTIDSYCNKSRQVDAYVKVTFGFVHSTVHLCPIFFRGHASHRVDVLVHEFGRLEDIGDSSHFDTNNIYVWDRIIGGLSNPMAFEKISGKSL